MSKCEFAEKCSIHENGEGCVLKHYDGWIATCSEWQKHANEERKTGRRDCQKVFEFYNDCFGKET